MNTVILVGNTGHDPVVKYFESGASKVTITLAVRGRDKKTIWFDIEAWGKTGDIIVNYAPKGTKLGVSGSLKIDSWNDTKTGERREKPVIVAEIVDLISSKKDGVNE